MLAYVATMAWMLELLGPAQFDVGSHKQLFIDQRFVAESANVTWQMNPGQKASVLRDPQGKPYQGYVSRTFEVDGKIRLYLGAEDVQILESDDGINFTPTGHELPDGTFPTIFLDPHETNPDRRYKLFHQEFSPPFNPEKHGVFASYSANGLDFTRVGRVFPFFADNPTVVHWDSRISKYVIYTRAFCYDNENQRRIARIEVDDPLQPWPWKPVGEHRIFPSIDNIPVVHSADADDDPHSDIYYNAAIPYPWAQDAYFMFPSHFRHFSPQRNPYIRPRVPGQWEDFGMLEVQVGISRDGIQWQRPSREPYFPTGLPDEWDRWYAVMGPGLVRRGNYLYHYYTSSGRLHDSVAMRAEYEKTAAQEGGVGVIRQRLDGFVSLDVDHHGGWLTTPPLTFRGNELRLNIDTGGMGTAFVELRDAANQPIPGFTLADCEEIAGNYIGQPVYWKGHTDVSQLAGQPVRIHFQLKRTKLYAFQFTASETSANSSTTEPNATQETGSQD